MEWSQLRTKLKRRRLGLSENATMAVIIVALCMCDIAIAWLLLAK
jgi:hypothetical protein